MLNIVEPVPPTEPIPSNSRNSVYHFQYNSGIPGISSYQFLSIPGIPSDSGIDSSSCYPHPHTLAIASNSWTEFRELSRAGMGWNSVRFRNWVIINSPSPSHPGYCIQFLNGIPELDEIPWNSRNSVRFRNWVIMMSPSPSHRGYCIQFLNGIPGIESSRNWTEFRGIPTDSGFTQFRNSGSELGRH
jgi:hypothetical protein